MGLDISVGSLAWLIATGADSEGLEWTRQELAEINRVLVANGLPEHAEPESLPEFESRCQLSGMPYSWLHYLRRALAYARQAPAEFTPIPEGEDPTEDPRLDEELSVYMDSHLICHSDSDGYYIPVDFPDPLFDDSVAGGLIGSSQQGMKELIRVAPLLGISVENDLLPDAVAEEINNEDGGPLYIERQVWLQLFERFRQSIRQNSVVRFC